MKGGHRTGSTGGGYQQALAQVHIQQVLNIDSTLMIIVRAPILTKQRSQPNTLPRSLRQQLPRTT